MATPSYASANGVAPAGGIIPHVFSQHAPAQPSVRSGSSMVQDLFGLEVQVGGISHTQSWLGFWCVAFILVFTAGNLCILYMGILGLGIGVASWGITP